MSVSLVIIILAVQAPAAPQVIMSVGAQWRAEASLWLNASTWVTSLGALLTGTQKPAPGRQATQVQRDGRVTRIQISPGDVTLKEGEQVDFVAGALDSADAQVSGVRFKWRAFDVERSRQVRMRDGRFVARRPGTFQVIAEGARQQATVTVQVLAGEDRQKRQEQPGIQKTVSSRDDEPEVSSRRVKRPTRRHDDADAPGSFKITNASFVRKAAPAAAAPLPVIDPEAGWGDGNGTRADDPGNRVGNPPGSPDDDGAGSGNFQLSVPVLGLPGRGQNVALGLAYNSLLWSKTNTNEVTYDADRGWPAAGWALGFGKIIGMNTKGSMLIEPDGTRRSFKCDPLYINGSLTNCSGKTLDGSFIEYFTSSWQGIVNYGYALYPNGTRIDYGAPANGAIYPIRVTDASGNYVTITYRANHGPSIENIYDTMGRVIQFHYDSAGLLTAVTAPDLISGTRTLVRLQYQNVSLGQSNNCGFAGNIAPHVRDANPPALKAIYFPGTNTGYWFGDADSYSPYGMLMKVVEQRSMSFSGPAPVLPSQGATGQGLISPGTASQQRAYDYPVALGTLTNAPTYTTATLSWANADAGDAQTGYFFLKNATNPSAPTVSSSKVEVTLPNNTKSVQYSYNLPGDFKDGLVYQDDTLDSGGTLISSSKVTWEKGADDSPRPSRVDATDERGQTLKTEFSYGPLHNQTTEIRAFDYDGIALLRRTKTTYQNSANYTNRRIFNLPLKSEVSDGGGVRVSLTEYEYDNATMANTPDVVSHDPAYDPYNTDMFDNGQCCRWEQGPFGEQYCAENCQEPVFNPATNYRGLVTKITSYSNAAPTTPTGAIAQTRTYDITGNLVTVGAACCEQTNINYTINTQFAYPESQARGAIDPTSPQRVTTYATHDFNTGLGLTATDANGRTTQSTYDQSSLRPQHHISPTGARTTFEYDDAQMTVTETSRLSAGGIVAAQSVTYLNGLGMTRRIDALGSNNAWDVVETKYDTLGRVWKQSRPYRDGSDQPQWSENFYDAQGRVWKTVAPDTSTTLSFYNETTRPNVAMPGAPAGQTTRIVDPWGRERWGRADAQGHLVELVEPNPTGDGTVANGGLLTTYAYDTLGNLTQVDQGVQQRRFRYDSLGRLTRQKLAETPGTLDDNGLYVGAGGQWSDTFAYDTRSNLIARTDPRGVTVNFAYDNDPLNRLQTISYVVGAQHDTSSTIAQAPVVNYEYMSSGDRTRPWKITAQGVRQDWYSYDSEGRLQELTAVVQTRTSYMMSTTYTYDTLDRVTDIAYPAQYQLNQPNPPRRVVHQDYDVASRLAELKYNGASYASQFGYNASSQVETMKVGVAGANQVTEKYVYDPTTGLVSEQKAFRGADDNSNRLLHLSYDYLRPGTTAGRTGQLTKITNNLNTQKGRTYAYDQLGRLKDATGGSPGSTPLWTQHYDYDNYGNRIGVTSSGNSAALNAPAEPSVKLPDVQLARAADPAPLPFTAERNAHSVSDSPPSLFGPADEGRASRATRAAAFVQSGSDHSLSLGGGAYASVPSSTSLNVTGALTLEAWVKTNAAAQQQSIVERYEWNATAGGYGLRLSPANKVQFFTAQNSSVLSFAESSAAVGTGAWHHIAGVFDGSQLRVYIDGVLAGSATGSVAPSANSSTLKVGAKGDDATSPFSGLIDEARVTAAALYTSNFTPQTRLSAVTGTKGLWKFDGQTTSDASGNGNNGSLVGGATYSTDVPAPPNQLPTVSITSPANNATFTAGSNINISANASDSDGSISKVEFFQGTTKLGEDTVSPYTYSWTNVAAGSYSLTAKATDNSGASNDSGAVNITVTTPATLHSLSLGGGAYASVPSSTSLNVTGALTLEAWVKTNAAAQQQSIVERYEWNATAGGYGLRLSPANKVQFFTAQNSSVLSFAESSAAVGTGAWHHIAGVFDGSQLRVYIDGALAGSATGSVAPSANSSTLKVGAKGDDATSPFSGLIDEARVTAAALYTSNFTPQTQLGNVSGTRGLWKFDGQTTSDASGNSNNGSLVGGATYSTDVPGQAAPNQQPVANAGGPYGANTGVAVQFSGSASYDPDGTIASYQWNFGDGASGTGATPTHGYATAGTYTATLTVTDNLGAQASASATVTVTTAVTPIPRDGLASLSYDQTTNRINSNGWNYDAAGNQIRTQTASGVWQRMEYDAANRLVAVKTDTGVLLSAYTYADTNARVITYENGMRTYYAWGANGVIAEYIEVDGTASASSPQWSKSYVYLGERLLATQQPNGVGGEYVEYHHPDRLGTRVVTNNVNASFYEQVSLPYGTAVTAESTGASTRRFTSYDRSQVSGLDYALNRHYDSAQGRFTQVDPLGMQASSLSDPQSFNLYAYCGNDPVNNTDPSGLFWGKLWRFIKKALKIIAIAITVAVAVITIVYAPYLFTTTLKAVLGIIAAVANAAQQVLSALGLKTAAAVFGIISAAASFGSSLAALYAPVAEKGGMTWKNIFKVISDGASLASKTLGALGHKVITQVLDIVSSSAGFISASLKDIKDKVTNQVARKFAPSAWEVYKFARSTAEKVANLAGATKVGGYLNVLGIVDDAYDFYRGIAERAKDETVPDDIYKLDLRHDRRTQVFGLDYLNAGLGIILKNRATRIGQEVGRINSIIGRVEKGIALAR